MTEETLREIIAAGETLDASQRHNYDRAVSTYDRGHKI